MRKLLLAGLLLPALGVFGQTVSTVSQNMETRTGVIVKQEQGFFKNQKGAPVGSYKILYQIDTVQQQLLNVSVTSKDGRGEVIYLYYYTENKLAKASSGVVQNGYTVLQNTYDYDADDYGLKEKDLNALSETDEKYALFKESKKYLGVLKSSKK